jgi:hypothetical protein
MDIPIPPLEVDKQAMQHLLLVLKDQDDSLKVLRLHLFSACFSGPLPWDFNPSGAATLRSDEGIISQVSQGTITIYDFI